MRADEETARCRSVIQGSVRRNLGDSLLLSGGLDTSIIAHAAARSRPKCFTVVFPVADAPDIPYARSVARKLGSDWEVWELAPELLRDRLADVIRILKTFDPMEVRNSVVTYHGLCAARDEGFSRVMTGDAADELFAGYSFSFNLSPAELMNRLRDLWKVMRFSSRPMAKALGMSASLPYLDRAVVAFAETLGPSQLVGQRDGIKYGKLILRLAFEKTIGRRIAWRAKTPIEYGSGTTHLPEYYAARITDSEFARNRKDAASNDGVRLRDKEQMEYYKLYSAFFPPPSTEARTGCRCPDCGSDVKPGSSFCTVCGAYPITTAAAR